ncbi:hypothetical protein EB796_013161 [Bugula neritina]|uniref:Uncharacterized protein n=1 Tax=Bugula neritina TaxID=10212 RepID=A0A7J7JT25_BUGNE|nr:hypothetical protein EB796_013161 [Bugula neritina]
MQGTIQSAATGVQRTNQILAINQPIRQLITSPTINSAGKSDNRNFRELAEQKRLGFLKKKSDSKEKLLPPPPVISQSESLKTDESLEARDEEDNSMSELQKIMSRLSVAKGEEPNNNVKKKPSPLVMKKPSKVQQPTSTQDHLSPVEEFPPPPPPHDFSSTANDILIPPPTFEIPPQIAALFPPMPSVSSNSKNEGSHSHPSQHGLHNTHQNHDVDNHSVTSSVGSDTISSVSQDGNRCLSLPPDTAQTRLALIKSLYQVRMLSYGVQEKWKCGWMLLDSENTKQCLLKTA